MKEDPLFFDVRLSDYPGAVIPSEQQQKVRDCVETLYNSMADLVNENGLCNGDIIHLLASLSFCVAAQFKDNPNSEFLAHMSVPFVSWAFRKGFGPVRGA